MAGANVHEFTDTNFTTEVLGASEPVLVDFWAEWCMPCRMMGPEIEVVASQTAGKAKVGKMDVEHHKVVAGQYGITSIPTVIIFKGGQPVRKFVGLTKSGALLAALNEAMK